MKLIPNKKEIRKAMIDLDLSYQGLADEVGLSRAYLSRILNDQVPESVAYNVTQALGGGITKYFKAEYTSEEVELFKEFLKSGQK